MSRRAAWLLIALCAWSLYVWITRIFIMAGEDHPAGFIVVHVTLALISIAFGLAAGYIGWRALRQKSAPAPAPATTDVSASERVGAGR